ncbi:hypothetical protein HanHA300_Chr12g0461751 [Helianthus annuus]|nr:hypothetical protein HanHA300_Chr12g0461751 [Helianthus annuus]KAJ0506887.1 hypothetical protein HanHA89_Chr12g0487151 [Helianthus annuus]KAJ0676525.1 hypothetical protein HanLR1_Chr12g0463771 [Helianthus annuus]
MFCLSMGLTRSKLRAYPEAFLVLLRINAKWTDQSYVPSFVVDGKKMSGLDFIMLVDLTEANKGVHVSIWFGFYH